MEAVGAIATLRSSSILRSKATAKDESLRSTVRELKIDRVLIKVIVFVLQLLFRQ